MPNSEQEFLQSQINENHQTKTAYTKVMSPVRWYRLLPSALLSSWPGNQMTKLFSPCQLCKEMLEGLVPVQKLWALCLNMLQKSNSNDKMGGSRNANELPQNRRGRKGGGAFCITGAALIVLSLFLATVLHVLHSKNI